MIIVKTEINAVDYFRALLRGEIIPNRDTIESHILSIIYTLRHYVPRDGKKIGLWPVKTVNDLIKLQGIAGHYSLTDIRETLEILQILLDETNL